MVTYVRGEVLERDEQCRCGALGRGSHSEDLCGGEYTTHAGFTCTRCGCTTEGSSRGIALDPEVRLARIAAFGLWALRVPASGRLGALAAIRTELGLSFAEATARRHPPDPLATGTFIEMARLRFLLARRGFDAEISK